MFYEFIFRLFLLILGNNGNAARTALIAAVLIIATAIAIVIIIQLGGSDVHLGPLHVTGTQVPAVTG
ncbi:hypothetical protein [Amycolatopsis circi]|uniref:hypothetical protein n=1 Tax=Amycolatopsis circi TaxID=871959 RepID=UPI0013BEAA18|nr:hypothetical protein [Amycolatopsis circi]